MPAKGSGPKHGYSGYLKGCRCPVCVADNSNAGAYFAGKRWAKLEAGATVEHGSPSTYHNWGCRCDPCKTAHRDQTREYRRRKAMRHAG